MLGHGESKREIISYCSKRYKRALSAIQTKKSKRKCDIAVEKLLGRYISKIFVKITKKLLPKKISTIKYLLIYSEVSSTVFWNYIDHSEN